MSLSTVIHMIILSKASCELRFDIWLSLFDQSFLLRSGRSSLLISHSNGARVGRERRVQGLQHIRVWDPEPTY